MRKLKRVVLPSARALLVMVPSGKNSYARITGRHGERVLLDRPLMGEVVWEMSDLQLMSEALSEFSDSELQQVIAEADAKV